MPPLGHSLRFSYKYLNHKKRHQIEVFESLAESIPEKYDLLRPYDYAEHVTEYWRESLSALEQTCLPRPPVSFLRDHTIRQNMFPTGHPSLYGTELERLETWLTKERLGEGETSEGRDVAAIRT